MSNVVWQMSVQMHAKETVQEMDKI